MTTRIPSPADRLRSRLRAFGSKEKAAQLMRYFKTGPGQYGEGDRFLGVMVPQTRRVAREFRDLPLPEVVELLRSPWHEERLCALLLLVGRFERGDAAARREIFDLYLGSTATINSWDLVDLSAHRIVGAWLEDRSRAPLYRLARSKRLWERRIAIIATARFIARADFADTLALSELLLDDEHDLMHKAVGWMLREVGKRDVRVLEAFLEAHRARMPRTALRYAIERLPEAKRQGFLRGETGGRGASRPIERSRGTREG
jgi:3-methyladenine DNA glycosylase AlkD